MMVSNIPLSQLTTSSEADSFSLVIWDGGDLVVSSESKLNLRKLRSDIDTIASSQLSNDSTLAKVDQQLSELTNTNSELSTSISLLSNNFSTVRQVVKGSTDRIASVAARISTLEQQAIALETSISESEAIAKHIKDGTLIVANDTNLSVSRNGAGNYVLVDSDLAITSLFPGLNIELDYNYQSGTYIVLGTIPELVSMFRDGRGIHVEGDASGKMTISVKSGLVVSIGGLDVTEKNDGTYVVSPTTSFISGDANRGMLSKRDPITGKFVLSLNQELLTKVGLAYRSGYGILQNKSEFSLDTSEIPTLHSGRGITITEKFNSTSSVTSTEYTATFDASTALIPPQPTVSSVYPITLEAVEVDSVYNVKDLKFGLSTEFTDNLDNVISILQSGINSINGTIGKLGWDNITEGMKLALACPMLKVFEVATGQYEQSGLVSSDANPIDLELLKRFGPGKHALSLNQDMLPYIAYSGFIEQRDHLGSGKNSSPGN
jgi:formylmethanofuran dehydrogenase subunit C